MGVFSALGAARASVRRGCILYEPLLLLIAAVCLFTAFLWHSSLHADDPIDPLPVMTNTISAPSPYTHPFPPPIAPIHLRAPGNGLAVSSIAILTYATPESPGDHRRSSMPLVNFAYMSDAEKAARITQHPLVTHLVPSLVATLEPTFRYSLFVGVDYEDPLFDNDLARRALDAALAALLADLPSAESVGYPVFSVFFVPLYGVSSHAARLNSLARTALTLRNEFFVVATTTTEFRAPIWTSSAVRALTGAPVPASDAPAPAVTPLFSGLGVVSLPDSALPDVPRTLIFSRVHLALFPQAFPLPGSKYTGYADVWLAQVYKPWRASHHLSSSAGLVTDHATLFYLTSPGNPQLTNPRLSFAMDTEPGDVGVYQTLQDGHAPHALHEISRLIVKSRKRLNMLLLGEYTQPVLTTHARAAAAARESGRALLEAEAEAAKAGTLAVAGPKGVVVPEATPMRLPMPHEPGGPATAAVLAAAAATTTAAAAAAAAAAASPLSAGAVVGAGASGNTAAAADAAAAAASAASGAYVASAAALAAAAAAPTVSAAAAAGGTAHMPAAATAAATAAAAATGAGAAAGAGAGAAGAAPAEGTVVAVAGREARKGDVTKFPMYDTNVFAGGDAALAPAPITPPTPTASKGGESKGAASKGGVGVPSLSLSAFAAGLTADVPDLVIDRYETIALPDAVKPMGRAIPPPSFHLVNSYDKCVYHEDACAREAKKYLGKKIAARWM